MKYKNNETPLSENEIEELMKRYDEYKDVHGDCVIWV